MDEIFTCLCGNQIFIINGKYIQCSGCNTKYILPISISAEEFNKNRDKYLSKKMDIEYPCTLRKG